MIIGKENFQDIRFPHHHFKIFPFYCGCGCGQMCFMQIVTRIGHFDEYGGYWEYFIPGHYERMVEKSRKENPEIPICINCKTHYHMSRNCNTYTCRICGYKCGKNIIKNEDK